MATERVSETIRSLYDFLKQRPLLPLLAVGYVGYVLFFKWVPFFIRFARRKPLGAVGAIIVAVFILVAIIGPFIAPFDPYKFHPTQKYAAPGETAPGGEIFILGTDHLGRDTLSRLLAGTRLSIRVGLISVGIGVTLGALIGVVGAYLGGRVDLTLQRIVDAMLSFPALILALAIMAVLGPSLNNVIFTLVIIFIPGSSRVVRSEALRVKETVYVEAARAIGCTDVRVIFRHVMPNCMAPYIVFATANLGLAIVVEASLSFLGAGVPVNVPSWGGMLAVAGSSYIEVSPWIILFSGLPITTVVFGFNLLGDALRDVLDPRLRGSY